MKLCTLDIPTNAVVGQRCRKPPRYVPYKGTYVPYDGTYGVPDQGQTLDVQEGQTAVLSET